MIKKHIKRKFRLQLPAKNIENIGWPSISLEKPLLKKEFDRGDAAFAVNDEGQATLCLIHKEKGKPHMFPIPDLPIVYLSQAQMNIKNISGYRQELLDKSAIEFIHTESSSNEFYQFYGAATGAIIFLSTSLESFLNQAIPESFIFRQPNAQKRYIEEYDHEQIQRQLTTDIKMKKVLPVIFGKDFYKILNKDTARLDDLKRLRDEIIHTKIHKNEMLYNAVIKKILAFDYDGCFQSITKFFNFYNPNYIVECDCGRDF